MAIMDVTILRLPNMQVGEQPTHIYGDEGGDEDVKGKGGAGGNR